jgi:hypothetical protein
MSFVTIVMVDCIINMVATNGIYNVIVWTSTHVAAISSHRWHIWSHFYNRKCHILALCNSKVCIYVVNVFFTCGKIYSCNSNKTIIIAKMIKLSPISGCDENSKWHMLIFHLHFQLTFKQLYVLSHIHTIVCVYIATHMWL